MNSSVVWSQPWSNFVNRKDFLQIGSTCCILLSCIRLVQKTSQIYSQIQSAVVVVKSNNTFLTQCTPKNAIFTRSNWTTVSVLLKLARQFKLFEKKPSRIQIDCVFQVFGFPVLAIYVIRHSNKNFRNTGFIKLFMAALHVLLFACH